MAQLTAWRETADADPGHTGFFVDFDGTISSIVADAASARPLPGALEVLVALARRYALVAVASGRPASFLAEHLPVPGVELWGSYGLEYVAPDGSVKTDPAAIPWRPAVAAAVAHARDTAPAGVGVEDKGIAVTLHVRGVPEQARWARDFARREAARTGLAVYDAKMSVEIRPPVEMDKGMVVARAVAEKGLLHVCVVGDDMGDLAAFRALDEVMFPMRVAVRSAESPASLLDAADVFVDGPPGALDFLRALV